MRQPAREPARFPPGPESPPRHSATVRLTHWFGAACFIALLVSGVAILLAHPRLYWGETGALGAPSLVDLPLPFVYGLSGWGRHLHFLAAWGAVAAGLCYVVYALASGHLWRALLPRRGELGRGALRTALRVHRRPPPGTVQTRYNPIQQLAYLAVALVLAPAMVWTGLAMSPAVTSALPGLVETLGGQQSARTLHFCAASLLALFVLGHVALTFTPGFGARLSAMITGHAPRASR